MKGNSRRPSGRQESPPRADTLAESSNLREQAGDAFATFESRTRCMDILPGVHFLTCLGRKP
jgi:hypothetical protein